MPFVRKRFAILIFVLTLASVAFCLNWFWEMIQMRAYQEMAEQSWAKTVPVCTIAALGDVLMTLAIYALGAVASGSAAWGARRRWNVYVTASLLGAGFAAAFEWFALYTGRWSYGDAMPVIPGLGLGLWPLLQLAVLVPASFFLTNVLLKKNFR